MRGEFVPSAIRWFCCWMVAIFTCVAPCMGHLGEDHPLGTHDYFPDFPLSPHSVDITKLFCLGGQREVREIPDGSGRFLVLMEQNQIRMVDENGRSNVFAQLGPTDVRNIQESTTFEFHPGYTDVNSDGFGKIYTITASKEIVGQSDFISNGGGFVQYDLIELTVSDISANEFTGTSRSLMKFETSQAFHQVNDLVFGEDESLYLSTGDDSNKNQVVFLSSLFGKVLRIDPLGNDSENGQYGIPSDNPFVSTPFARPEIYAIGFRNPFRLAYDNETQNLFAFEVGENSIEEVDLVKPGENFGWPAKEGSFVYDRAGAVPDEPDPETGLTVAEQFGYTDPLFEFDHTDAAAVIGGMVYQGSEFPGLVGKLVFAGWNIDDLFVPPLYIGDVENGDMSMLLPPDGLERSPLSVSADADGEILVLTGTCVYRLTAGRELLGDANNNGIVDAEDLNIVGRNWLASGKTYSEGDFDGDGVVDVADLNIIGANWLATSAAHAAVPEPSGMLSLMWLLLLWQFRRRAS